MIPTKLTINGLEVDPEQIGVPNPVPGCPGWALAVGDVGGVRLLLWCLGPMPFSLWVVNNREVPVEIADGGNPPFILLPLSGHRFGNVTLQDAHGKSIALPGPVFNAVSNDIKKPDIPNTLATGSSEMEFYDKLWWWSKAFGKSTSIVAACFSYLDYNAGRGRWWLDEQGRPMWFTAPNAKWAGFSLFALNNQGKNAGDPNHPDESELLTGWRLTGCPEFLFAMVNFWCFGLQHFTSWDASFEQSKGAYAYGGAPRQPGWFLRNCGDLQRALRPLQEIDGYRLLLEAVEGRGDDHVTLSLDLLRAGWWAPWTNSRVKEIATAKVDSLQPWEVAVNVFGAASVGADALADEGLAWLAEHGQDENGVTYTTVSKDGAIKVPGAIPGTAAYLLPALIASGRGESEQAKYLRSRLKSYDNQQNAVGVGWMAPLLFTEIRP
jgi:hypothetical protein